MVVEQAVVHDTEEGVVVVDLNHSRSLHARHRKGMLDQVMQTEDMDNQLFLQRIKERLDRSASLFPPACPATRSCRSGERQAYGHQLRIRAPNCAQGHTLHKRAHNCTYGNTNAHTGT